MVLVLVSLLYVSYIAQTCVHCERICRAGLIGWVATLREGRYHVKPRLQKEASVCVVAGGGGGSGGCFAGLVVAGGHVVSWPCRGAAVAADRQCETSPRDFSHVLSWGGYGSHWEL